MPYQKTLLFWESLGLSMVPAPSHAIFLSLPILIPASFSPVPWFPWPCTPAPSVAKALCVKTVGAQTLKLYQEHPIFSEVISDQEAVAAIEKFVGMCRVLSRLDLLLREPSGCSLVCQGSPSPRILLTVLSPIAS